MNKKLKARNNYLKRKYGITLRQYNKKLKAQSYSCALCNRHYTNFTNSLAVDHNHATGNIRGLLCFTCNKMRVGKLNLEWAKAVYEYLLRYDS